MDSPSFQALLTHPSTVSHLKYSSKYHQSSMTLWCFRFLFDVLDALKWFLDKGWKTWCNLLESQKNLDWTALKRLNWNMLRNFWRAKNLCNTWWTDEFYAVGNFNFSENCYFSIQGTQSVPNAPFFNSILIALDIPPPLIWTANVAPFCVTWWPLAIGQLSISISMNNIVLISPP